MKLSNVMKEEFVIPQSDSKDLHDLLEQIAAKAIQAGSLSGYDKDSIKKALLEREKQGSTAFGNGIAIPHCALGDVDSFVVGLARIPEGVEMNSLDGKPVNLAVFIIGPEDQRNEHIHLLSKVSKVLNSDEARKELLAQDDASLLLEIFLKNAADEVDQEDEGKKVLTHIFVQNEDWFEEVLQILPEVESSVISIVRADDTSRYLDSMPLFSGFLSDKKGFNRMIVSVIPKAFANDTIRRISDVTGDISKAHGIKVVMQDLFYSVGNFDY